MWYFACDSDQHFHVEDGVVTHRKANYVERYKNINKVTKLDFVL
jgi:hypothetical protein